MGKNIEILENFKTAITSTVKSIAGDQNVEVVFGDHASKSNQKTINLPIIKSINNKEDFSKIRALADSEALKIKCSDPNIFNAYEPKGNISKVLYKVAERTRYETVGAKYFKGIKQNLDRYYKNKLNQKIEYNNQDFEFIEAFENYLKNKIFKIDDKDSANKFDKFKKKLDTKLQNKIEILNESIFDQDKFNSLISKIISQFKIDEQTNKKDKDEENKDQNNLENSSNDKDNKDSKNKDNNDLAINAGLPELDQIASEINEELELDEEDNESLDAPPGRRKSGKAFKDLKYKVYTQEFDEIIKAEELENEVELIRLRNNLDQQLVNLKNFILSIKKISDFIFRKSSKNYTSKDELINEFIPQDEIKDIITNKYNDEVMTLINDEKNNFFVSTLSKIKFQNNDIGYIVVSEQANDITTAVKERKAFIIRTMIAVVIVILIFSLFLNKYILKPIGLLVKFSEGVKKKSNQTIDINKVFIRNDEIGKLTQSIDEMTKELQHRTNRAETFSNDLAHEIRNPLASLKSASELLDKTTGKDESEKLLKIINHDVERIERLITDYSQMLKDEASLSREKMSKINLIEIINNVAEDFKQDLKNQNKNIQIKIKDKINSKNGKYILGIENRLEQVIANLLDNSISFSQDNQKIEISVEETTKNLVMKVKDEGPGFSETSPQKIFKRFYSNRPASFGKHSGLGLNIVKNIVQLHKGTVAASNRLNAKGAQVEVLLPKVS